MRAESEILPVLFLPSSLFWCQGFDLAFLLFSFRWSDEDLPSLCLVSSPSSLYVCETGERRESEEWRSGKGLRTLLSLFFNFSPGVERTFWIFWILSGKLMPLFSFFSQPSQSETPSSFLLLAARRAQIDRLLLPMLWHLTAPMNRSRSIALSSSSQDRTVSLVLESYCLQAAHIHTFLQPHIRISTSAVLSLNPISFFSILFFFLQNATVKPFKRNHWSLRKKEERRRGKRIELSHRLWKSVFEYEYELSGRIDV